ncbi:MAG: 50S ribosomal protein L20 [Nitrospirota bacterium]|uniref:LSU ribosomal protein L20p n=1 Tax=hydrothermal vent metagenome TaxID=652676 RepID=A0A3B1D3Y3_9ZZZZ|nr:50S ribosomal protein L20 [Nitrospirota bacterium]
MPRAKGGPKTRQRRKARLKMAKGYYGAKSKLFRTATEAVDKSLLYAYRDRRNRKRAFRRLWITRISAAAKLNGLNYSRLMDGLKKAGITLNRKILAEIAAHDPAGFTQIVEKMQARTEAASA